MVRHSSSLTKRSGCAECSVALGGGGGAGSLLLCALQGGSRLSEVLTWVATLGLSGFLVYATGSPAVVLVWIVGVWCAG